MGNKTQILQRKILGTVLLTLGEYVRYQICHQLVMTLKTIYISVSRSQVSVCEWICN